MKKLISLILIMICMVVLIACNETQQEENNTNTHTLKVTENSVGEIGRKETYNFSECFLECPSPPLSNR